MVPHSCELVTSGSETTAHGSSDVQDRHFLDLLVMSEIHCLSHPLQSMQSPPGQAERIHRHASRVRRVACERIGAERLHAYCERVKEAFEAYVQCGWGARGTYDTPDVMEEDESSTDDEMSGVGEADESVESETSAEDGVEGTEEDEERGRSVARGDGSVERDISPGQMNRSNLPSMAKRMIEEAGEPPFAETRMEADSSEGDLKSLILEDVQEAEEEKTWVLCELHYFSTDLAQDFVGDFGRHGYRCQCQGSQTREPGSANTPREPNRFSQTRLDT